MKISIRIFSGSLLLLFTACIQSPHAQNCPTPTQCPYGSGSGTSETDLVCQSITVALLTLQSACRDYYGTSLSVTDESVYLFGLANTPDNVCDYYRAETTVVDCLYENGTLEIKVCGLLWGSANILKDNCTKYYTINNDTTTLGDLVQQFTANVTANCRPSPETYPYQLNSSGPKKLCPNCKIRQCPNTTEPCTVE